MRKPTNNEKPFHKHRLEALSDGVFAIVMTLLVLELKVPHTTSSADLLQQLQSQSGYFYSYSMTFAIAAVYWMMQHRVFDYVDDAGSETAIPTFIFLAFMSLLPFTTPLIGGNGRFPLAFVIYFGNLAAAAGSLIAKLELARAHGRIHPDHNLTPLRFRLYRNASVMLMAALGACLFPPHRLWILPITFGLFIRATQKFVRIRGKQIPF